MSKTENKLTLYRPPQAQPKTVGDTYLKPIKRKIAQLLQPKGFEMIRPLAQDGRAVAVLIRSSLLNPVGKRIAAILHFYGTRIYLQKGQQITVGNSRECDIRIMDEGIEKDHLKIRHSDNGIELTPMNCVGEIIIGDEKTTQVSSLSFDMEGGNSINLTESRRIFFELSGIAPTGKKRLLEMKLEIPQTISQAAREFLVIEQVSPEQVLARIEDQSNQLAFFPIDEEIIINTSFFSKVRTITDVLDIYLNRHSTSEQKFMPLDKITRAGLVTAGASMILEIFAAGLHAGASAIIFFTALFLTGISTAGITYLSRKNKSAQLAEAIKLETGAILKKLDPEMLAGALAERTRTERKEVLVLLNRERAIIVQADLRDLFRLGSRK